MPTSFLPPELVWGLLPRIVGVAFLIAFVSLARQVVPLVGSRGVSPLRHRIARLRRDVPAPRRGFEMPGLVWLSHSDAALAALPVLGALGALLAVVGGPLGSVGLLSCWICWLSLDVCGLWLPWDTLLLEVGFLALFLPATRALPDVHALAAPLPSVAFLFRWLLIRLMWGFAKLKFLGTEKGDGMYLQGFLTWLPMPTPLGWLFQKAPKFALRLGCAFMWTAEVVAPLLCCFSGTPRLVGAALLVLLMAGIQSTGNWGHFNLAYAGLCVLLLDTSASLSDVFAGGAASGVAAAPDASLLPSALTNACMAALFVASLVLFPLNSWVTQAATQWNADRFTWRRPWLERLLHALRLVNRLRLVGAYGVFPPNTSPPIKMVPVLEGSHDGVHFTPIPWRFMPVDERSPPRFIAPYHPRLDHSSIYVGLGLNESDPVGGLMFEVKPYGCSPYSQHSWLQRVVQRVLEGEPGVLGLLGRNPFANRPPTFVRVVHVCLKPASLAEHRKSGRWWHARTMCVLHEPVRSDPALWQHWIAEPEGVHPELSHWRRRSPALARMRAAVAAALLSETETETEIEAEAEAEAEAGAEARARVALCAGSELAVADVAAFWDEFVPWLDDPSRRDDWSALPRTVDAMRARFGTERLRAFERVHQRAVHALEARVEPHAYGDARPHWEVANAFDLQATLAAVVLDGEGAWTRAYRDPALVVARAASLDEAALLFPTGLFRWELVRFVVLGLRARTRLSRAPEMLFGIGRHQRFLASVDVGPQWLPTCIRSDDGSWSVPVAQFDERDGEPRHAAT